MEEKLQLDSTYEFQSKPIKGLERAFPECFESKKESKIPPCKERQELLTLLRQQAFLNQNDPKLWEKVSCLHRLQGLNLNADYYQTLSESTDYQRYFETFPDRLKRGFYNLAIDHRLLHDWLEQNPEIVLSIPLEKRDDIYIDYFRNHPLTPDRLHYLVENSTPDSSPSDFDKGVMEVVERNPGFLRHPKLIISLIDKNNFPLETWLKYMAGGSWIENPEAVVHLLKKFTEDKVTDNQIRKAISLAERMNVRRSPELARLRDELSRRLVNR